MSLLAFCSVRLSCLLNKIEIYIEKIFIRRDSGGYVGVRYDRQGSMMVGNDGVG